MLIDGISLTDTSDISNLIVDSGTSFPDGTTGEIFYRTDLNTLYIYNGTVWGQIGSSIGFDDLNIKPAATIATTANITLSGTQTIDGYTTAVSDRVLVKNQALQSQNGIYVVSASAWTRASDFDGSPSTEVKSGDFVFVQRGSTQADTGWVLTTDGAITIGTTALTFAQFTGAAAAAGGSSTQVQYNNGGAFAGSAGFTWNNAQRALYVGDTGLSTAFIGGSVVSGAAPALTVRASSSTTGVGATLNLESGATAVGAGALVQIKASDAADGVGGTVRLLAGAGVGGGAVRAGGNIEINGGAAGSGSGSPGGDVIITSGTAFNNGTVSGNVIIRSGFGGSGGTAGYLSFFTGNSGGFTYTERFRINPNGSWSVGTGGTAVGTAGQVLTSNGNAAPSWQTVGGNFVTLDTAQTITGTKTFTGKILAGHTSSIDFQGNEGRIQAVGAAGGDSRTLTATYSASASGPAHFLAKTRSATIDGRAAVLAGDSIGTLLFAGADGSSYTRGASVAAFAEANATVGTGSPGYLTFATADSTAPNVLTERMRITSVGAVSFGSSGTAVGTSGQVLTSSGSTGVPTWAAPSAAITLTTAAQPNVTSLGTLSSLSVTGNVSAATPTLSNHLATKNYVDNAAAGPSVGDILVTARALSAPTWLPANGSVYLQSAYPQLFSAIGLLPDANGGAIWTQRTSGFGSSGIRVMAFGNGVFVAAGENGTLATSTDGITWTIQTSGFGAGVIRAITFGNGIFVAVGDGGVVNTSADGVTWAVGSFGGSTELRAVTFANGLFVLGGVFGTLATSTDGISWTTRSSGFGANAVQAITFGNGVFVAVGGTGTTSAIATSPDGLTWTIQSAGHPQLIDAITFGAGRFVAVGDRCRITTSTDGITWTARTVLLNLNALFAVRFGSGLFVAGGSGSNIATSPDGVIWTPRISASAFLNVNGIADNGAGLFAMGGNTGFIATSLVTNYNTATQFATPTVTQGLTSAGTTAFIRSLP